MKSIRQDRLTQDARDLLAWAFSTMSLDSVEVKIEGDQLRRITDGDGFRQHVGSCSFSHRDDPGWAVVFEEDCDGCPKRGILVMERLR